MCKDSTSLNLFSDEIPYGYCHCGCGQETKIARSDDPRYGTIKGLPLKFINGHNRRRSALGPEYIVDEITGCWNWTGALDENGYGHVSRKEGNHHDAHRFIYERHKGSIPSGLHLDHLCRNPACVNPEHLEPVTIAENVRRGKLAKLNMQQVQEIRTLFATTDMTNYAIATIYGVSSDNISKIRRGHTWLDKPNAKRSVVYRFLDSQT